MNPKADDRTGASPLEHTRTWPPLATETEDPLKKILVTAVLAIALLGVIAIDTPAAQAVPKKTTKCNACHRAASVVKIKLTRGTETSGTVKYSIKVSGGKGVAGWAVFSGTKNIKHATKATGSFIATQGATYTVRAVKKGSGSASKKITIP